MGLSPGLTYAAASIGTVLNIMMLMSPIGAVLHIRSTGDIQDINPLPYPMTAVNCLAWIVYGAIIADPFIPPANIIGLAAGIFFTLSALPACDRKMQDLFLWIFIVIALLFGGLSMVTTFALTEQAEQKTMPAKSRRDEIKWGFLCVAILCIYYLIPLSSVLHIIRTRDASSIYLPLGVAAMVNGTMWTIYGLAIGNPIIAGPNAFGALVGLIQVLLRLFYGRKAGIKEDALEMRRDAKELVSKVKGMAAGVKADPMGVVRTVAGAAKSVALAVTAPPPPGAASAAAAAGAEAAADGTAASGGSDSGRPARPDDDVPLRTGELSAQV
ncbi:hypothetical protein FOA52_010924 [Chlamydomonas sp. UWO 241]|nr:hypothetical protein FOA52_010924 [Chlamydomonas sp. UWO 241]